MFRSTRRRLTLWYTTVTAILLIVFGSFFYVYVRQTLIDRVDDTLYHVAEVVTRSLVVEEIESGGDRPLRVDVEGSFRENAEAVEDDRIDLEWFDPTGALQWSTSNAPNRIPLRPDVREAAVRSERGSLGLREELLLRQIVRPVVAGDRLLGYLRVSHPWFEVTRPVRQLVWDLVGWISAMVLVVAATGFGLSALAMKPIREAYDRLQQFTADVSHELRNPIAAIKINAQEAIGNPELDPQIQAQFQAIERLARRIGRLVDNLLFLERQDSAIELPARKQCLVESILAQVLQEQQLLAKERGIRLVLAVRSCPHLSYWVEGDPNQLARLFANLASNAIQYSPDNREVRVIVRPEKQRHGGDSVGIQVCDRGVGIPAEDLPRIFDRFYRGDAARVYRSNSHSQSTTSGAGLGLAIARSIVEKHRGQINVESVLHQGTTVSVVLPLAKQR